MEKTTCTNGRVILIDSAEALRLLCRRMLCSGFDGDVAVARGLGRWFMIMSEIPLYACDYGEPLDGDVGLYAAEYCRVICEKDGLARLAGEATPERKDKNNDLGRA